MTQDVRIDGAAAGRRGARALLLLAAAPFVFSGCHDEERLRQRLEGPPARLPVEPDQPSTPPAPALLDTVRPWQQPKAHPLDQTRTWSLVCLAAGDGVELTYRVPVEWRTSEDCDGTATNRGNLVDAQARVTELEDSEISLASYAAQLAEGNPIFQYSTTDGHIV